MILESVTRAVIQLIKTRVYSEVDVQTHPDFGEVAGLPAVILTLPMAVEVPGEESNQERRVVDYEAGIVSITPPPVEYDLEYGVMLAAASPITTPATVGLLELHERYLRMVAEVRVVRVGDEWYRMTHEPGITGNAAVPAGPVLSVRSSLWVRGVRLEPEDVRVAKLVRERRIGFHRLEEWPWPEVTA